MTIGDMLNGDDRYTGLTYPEAIYPYEDPNWYAFWMIGRVGAMYMPANDPILGVLPAPRFVDIDADGDLDLALGESFHG